MTAREIILELARDHYESGLITEESLRMMANNPRAYQRAKQLLNGFHTQKAQKGQ